MESLQELQIVPFPPAIRGPHVQVLEFGITIEVLPGADYDSHSFKFSSLEWLSVPTLTEVRISLEFINNGGLRAPRPWISDKWAAWMERIKAAAVNKAESLAYKMLESSGKATTWVVVNPPDAAGQESRILTMKRGL